MKSIESYIEWVRHKFKIDSQERKYQIQEGEVYWCSLGVNVGDEENGKGLGSRRPVLIFKKFNNNIFLGVPLSTKNKDSVYYVKVLLKDEEVSAMISQIRVIDTKRLDKKIGYIKNSDFKKVKEEVLKMLS